MKVLAGIDGGGSKTVGVVGDEQGTVLGRFVTGPSNILKDGALAVKKALSEALEGACSNASPSRRSGYDIARRGLQAVLQGIDGRGPATSISQKIAAELFVSSSEQVAHELYRGQLTEGKIASLYPLIDEAAREGDSVALQLFEDAVGHLADAARAVVKELALVPGKALITVAGGALVGSPFLRECLDRAVTTRGLASLRDPFAGAEIGALLIAGRVLRGQPHFDPD